MGRSLKKEELDWEGHEKQRRMNSVYGDIVFRIGLIAMGSCLGAHLSPRGLTVLHAVLAVTLLVLCSCFANRCFRQATYHEGERDRLLGPYLKNRKP